MDQAQALINALQQQRNAALDDAARYGAEVLILRERVEALEAKVANPAPGADHQQPE